MIVILLPLAISVLALSQCRPSLCNGGRCGIGRDNQVHCECLKGFTGPTCEESECVLILFIKMMQNFLSVVQILRTIDVILVQMRNFTFLVTFQRVKIATYDHFF